jgi:hypothetical protein
MRAWVVALAFIFTILSTVQFSSAQHFVKMSDRQRIELALDMVRKGVQQQDTTKVFMVFAPQVLVKGKNIKQKGDLTKRFQAVFDNSSERKSAVGGLERPSFSREDNPLRLSNFWDFDILDPGITIKGDSAIVDCELVLWGAPPDGKSPGAGRKVKERFVFISPPKVLPATVPEGSQRFPAPPPDKTLTGRPRAWQLVGFENLLEFLENQVGTNTGPKEKTPGEKR